MGDGKEECPICLDELRCEPVAVLGSCCHRYHISCLEAWFAKKNLLVCPVCNQESIGYYSLKLDKPETDPALNIRSMTPETQTDTDPPTGNQTIPPTSVSRPRQNPSPTTLPSPTQRNISPVSPDSGSLTSIDMSEQRITQLLARIATAREQYRANERPMSNLGRQRELRQLYQNNSFYLAGDPNNRHASSPRFYQLGNPRYRRDSLSTISLSSERASLSLTPPLAPETSVSGPEKKTTRCGCSIQ